MTEYRFSSIIIGVIFASLFVGVFSLFFADIASSNQNVDFDKSTVEDYNKMEESISLTNDIRRNESEMQRRGGDQDVLGGWFEQGYKTLRVSKQSFETVDSMSKNAAEDLGLGSPGVLITTAIVAILSLIGVFIIISTLTKRES